MQLKNVIHRDIKNANILLCIPEKKLSTEFDLRKKISQGDLARTVNILLKQDDFGEIVVKIGDFGFSTFLNEHE